MGGVCNCIKITYMCSKMKYFSSFENFLINHSAQVLEIKNQINYVNATKMFGCFLGMQTFEKKILYNNICSLSSKYG